MTDRAKFEEWCRSEWGGDCTWLNQTDGYAYASHFGNDLWRAWQASRKQALEEAALECEANARYWNCQAEGGGTMLDDGKSLGGTLCAEDIRALANPEGER